MKKSLSILLATYSGLLYAKVGLSEVGLSETIFFSFLIGIVYILVERKNNSLEETIYSLSNYTKETIFLYNISLFFVSGTNLNSVFLGIYLIFLVQTLTSYLYIFVFERELNLKKANIKEDLLNFFKIVR